MPTKAIRAKRRPIRLVHDIYGRHYEVDYNDDIKSMLFPVRHKACNGVFDEADVQPIARYAECDVYRCPCCDREMDNRTWTAHGVERLKYRNWDRV